MRRSLRLRKHRSVLLALLAVLTLALAASLLARPAHARGEAVITSVSFSGTPAKPIVTVTGRGLVVPRPNPAGSPSNKPLCPKVIHGKAGLNYGQSLYLTAFNDDMHLFSAGRYRPNRNELDCIGLIILSHTKSQIRFTLGAAYRQPDFGYQAIENGALVEMVVGNAAYGLVVHYR